VPCGACAALRGGAGTTQVLPSPFFEKEPPFGDRDDLLRKRDQQNHRKRQRRADHLLRKSPVHQQRRDPSRNQTLKGKQMMTVVLFILLPLGIWLAWTGHNSH